MNNGLLRMDLETSARRTAALEVFVNGAATSTRSETLDDLLSELGQGSARVATAVNGEFVPQRARAARRLTVGDRVEIVSPRQGG